MCVIVVKEKGKDLPSETILKECFTRNPDGAGFVYHDGKTTQMSKGFMNFEDFKVGLSYIENIKEVPLIMHFRIGTQGANDGPTTHPFPITDSVALLQNQDTKNGWYMAHNGVLSSYSYNKTLSDTQLFVRDFLEPLLDLDTNFIYNKKIYNMIDHARSVSRLVFMSPKGDIVMMGNFTKDNDIFYSNTSYKPYEKPTYYVSPKYTNPYYQTPKKSKKQYYYTLPEATNFIDNKSFYLKASDLVYSLYDTSNTTALEIKPGYSAEVHSPDDSFVFDIYDKDGIVVAENCIIYDKGLTLYSVDEDEDDVFGGLIND